MSLSAIKTGLERQSNSSELKSASVAPELSSQSRSMATSHRVGDSYSSMEVKKMKFENSQPGIIAPSIKLINSTSGLKISFAISVLQILEAVNPRISIVIGHVTNSSLFE